MLFLFLFSFCFYLSDELDESGIDFVKKCIQIIERRGLHEQGLYRIVGMQSKVNSVVVSHFGKKNIKKFDLKINIYVFRFT